MPSGTGFNPRNINEFEKAKLNKDAKGISKVITAGQTETLDLILTDDILLSGGTIFLAKNATQGDTVDFQVLMGETVINQFVSNWFINPDSTLQQVPSANYPAKLYTGLTLRIKYTSVGTNGDVWIAVNYNIEKILE